MEKLWKVYCHEIPEFIKEFSQVPEMIRLQDVGMNCGCEYTNFEIFRKISPYSRYEHSIGVALIIWNFTHDKGQTIAGLFHDIATPVFAHTIDFLNGDYEKQESTETNTENLIESSNQIIQLTQKHDLPLAAIVDYHRYPIADNDAPFLAADRLEYTLGNMFNYGYATLDEIQAIYEDLMVGIVDNQEELMFKSRITALLFSERMLECSSIYICDEDRFAMQSLADLMKVALELGVIAAGDLYSSETAVIEKIKSHGATAKIWEQYQNYTTIKTSDVVLADRYCVQVSAKKRFINPMVANKGRIAQLDRDISGKISKINEKKFDYWLYAIND